MFYFDSYTDIMDMNATRHGVINNPRGEKIFLLNLTKIHPQLVPDRVHRFSELGGSAAER